MTAKKIVASDMRTALQKVRDELGAEAVILANRKIAGGVEITASVNYQSVLDAHERKQREQEHVPAFVDRSARIKPKQFGKEQLIEQGSSSQAVVDDRERLKSAFADVKRNSKPSLNDAKPAAEKNRQYRHAFEKNYDRYNSRRAVLGEYDPHQDLVDQLDDELADPIDNLQQEVAAHYTGKRSPEDYQEVQEELNQLKSLLNSQLNQLSWGDYSYRHPLSAAIFKRLQQLGLSARLCRSLLNQVDETLPRKQAWLQVLTDLGKRIPISSDGIIDQPGVVAFVGPAGVGKTTTIAKLAAEYALRHGPESLALVTTDSYRIAGHEQLRTLAQILRVPLRIVNEQNSLPAVISSLARKRMIFIDTAGLSARDESFDHQMRLLEHSAKNMRTWLVLSSISQRKILEKTLAEYKHLKLSGSILTKLDESASLGEAISVIVENGLALAYITDGQNIPDDIQRPKANQLINMALSLTREAEADESELVDLFAQVGMAS